MATRLDKPVTRVVADWSRGGCGKDSHRPLMVTLNPAGFISFRLKGLRQDYDVDFATVYSLAVRRYADKAAAEAKREKAMKREGLA